jgi:hypothetical protein
VFRTTSNCYVPVTKTGRKMSSPRLMSGLYSVQSVRFVVISRSPFSCRKPVLDLAAISDKFMHIPSFSG